ncbi:MAG TPA: DUF1254 domain-containing protein [Hyphomonadaceae bacterium]|nr:DUF1254 domain-containing protein [Hyphomonadaceae bacterium]
MRRRDVLWSAGALGVLGLAGCQTSSTSGQSPSSNADADLDAAFFYSFPLYEIARTGQNRAAAPGLNKLGHRAVLADDTMRQITAPNNDTVYSSAQLELSGGPIEVNCPTDTSRYFNVTFMDAFSDNFAGMGTRLTKGQGGKYWVVGPAWKGSAPAGVTVLRSSTNDVWMLARIVVEGPDDLVAAKALQQKISIRQVEATPPKPFGVAATSSTDPVNYLAVVNDMIARSPGSMGHLARAPKFAKVGVGITPSAELIERWRAYLPKGIAKLKERFLFRDLVVNGWGYQPHGVGEKDADDLLRSAIALGGLAALPEAEAMYFQATVDGAGAPLTGANKYVWRVPPGGVPAEAFWSLTMYQVEDDGRFFLTKNPINRFSIGDRTKGLVKNADGSIDILIQRDQPTGDKAANWLPAPAGAIRLSLRAYLPKKELRDRAWKVPPVTKA